MRPFENDVLAPDFFPIELANALLKKVRRRELTEREARSAVGSLEPLIRLMPSVQLLQPALDIAFRYERSIYDSLYVALAVQESCPLVTADHRFYDALAPSSRGALLWVEDVDA